MVVFVLLGIFAGSWADTKFATEPALLLAGFFLGASVGIYQLIQKTKVPPSDRS